MSVTQLVRVIIQHRLGEIQQESCNTNMTACRIHLIVQPEVLVRWQTAHLGKVERLQGAWVVGQMALFVCVGKSTGDVRDQSATKRCKSALPDGWAGGVLVPCWSATARFMTSAGDFDRFVGRFNDCHSGVSTQ